MMTMIWVTSVIFSFQTLPTFELVFNDLYPAMDACTNNDDGPPGLLLFQNVVLVLMNIFRV